MTDLRSLAIPDLTFLGTFLKTARDGVTRGGDWEVTTSLVVGDGGAEVSISFFKGDLGEHPLSTRLVVETRGVEEEEAPVVGGSGEGNPIRPYALWWGGFSQGYSAQDCGRLGVW